MSGHSAKIVTVTIFGGAVLGAVYDGVGLIDRWRATGSVFGTDPATTAPEPAAIAIPAPTAETTTDAATVAPAAQPPAEETDGNPLRARLANRLRLELERLGCEGITLAALDLSPRFTPAAEATSGFDSLYLEAQVTLRGGGTVAMVDLSGSGKGPGHEARATDAAAHGLSPALSAEDFGDSCSKLENE
ncbi:hypothetical protein [Roseovarius sp. E0-M6]|uniref:hypothetical protein n=1 Tax=Roseovarius sp. E0-M6 TaxID=3127118 RepID=UPI00300FCFAD